MLKKTILILWLFLLITMLIGTWLTVNGKVSSSYPILILQLAQPFLVLVLSLYVFNRTPPWFRIIHHGFTLLTLFLAIAFSYMFIFHGGTQGGVGLYLLTYAVAAIYFCFISVFLLVLAIRKYRNTS